MGKIRTKIIGLEEIEKQQKEEAKKRQAAKKAKKGDVDEPTVATPVEDILEDEKAKADAKAESASSDDKTTIEDAETKKLPPQLRRKKVTGKKYKEAQKLVDAEKVYSIEDALALVKKMSYAQFDETVELHVNVREQGLKGEVTLPHGTGKDVKVAIVDEKVLKELEAGNYDFDILIAAPADMPKLVPFARELGPRGLMPNPKKGTVADNPKEAAEKFKGGTVYFKTEAKAKLMHQPVGKLSLEPKKLAENIRAFLKAVGEKNIRSASISASMTPGVKIEVTS